MDKENPSEPLYRQISLLSIGVCLDLLCVLSYHRINKRKEISNKHRTYGKNESESVCVYE